MNGYTKLYFTDETGRLFRDETGNNDHGRTIPLDIELGRNNFNTDQKKTYNSVLVDSENARGATIQYSVDGGQFRTLGTIHDRVGLLVFKQRGQLVEGRDINYRIVHNEEGDPTVINGIITYYSVSEGKPDESSRR